MLAKNHQESLHATKKEPFLQSIFSKICRDRRRGNSYYTGSRLKERLLIEPNSSHNQSSIIMSGGGGPRSCGGVSIGRTVLDCIMHKLPSTRKYYRVSLIVPESGIPVIEYYQARGSASRKKPRKTIHFVDLWFSDRKHDTNEKFAFSIFTVDKTVTFLAQDETTMNEWLTKIREYHYNLYPELTQYDAIFEATLLDKGLGKTMNIHGPYRLALCKESLDLVPLLTPAMIEQLQQQQQTNQKINQTNTKQSKLPSALASLHHHHDHHHHHHHPPQSLVNFQETTSTDTTITNDADSDFMHLDNLSNHQPTSSTITTSATNTPNPLHHPHIPKHLPSDQRFSKRHPWVAQKTIQLARRSIRRCGHTDSNFYIESGRHSTIGEGDLWFALNKKSTARNLHELLLATIRTAASQADDQFLCKAPRSRSGSSSDTAHYRSQQSRSSSLVCLNSNNNHSTDISATSNNNNNNNLNSYNHQSARNQTAGTNQLVDAAAAAVASAKAAMNNSSALASSLISTIPMFSSASQHAQVAAIKNNADQIDEDCGYLPMA